jgi:predicted transcriptional regulator
MKKVEQIKARKMRHSGFSVKEITKELGVAKSSVSVWVRDIELTKDQKIRLSEKGHTLEVIEKRRATRLANESARKEVMINAAISEIDKLSKRDLMFFGIAAYWGEGAKKKPNSVEFFNSDPKFVRVMMRFFKEVCCVPNAKFKGRIQLHEHLNPRKAERYWIEVSGIPFSQFQTTTQQHNKSSKNKKDTLPFGTFMIGVYDTRLALRIAGWMEGVYRRTS